MRRAVSAAHSNRLLAALPGIDRRRMLAAGETVDLVAGNVLCESTKPLRHAYFPIGAYISLVTPLDACPGLEVGLIGNEGMVGVPLLLGVAMPRLTHIVQGAGNALRVSAAAFRRELAHSPALRRRLDRYAFVKMHQLAQTAACVRFHVVEARLARWLLMAQDRARCDEFHATHEFLAYMLGVRRVGVTKAATSLQNQSLIEYGRGDITVLDRRGLEARACDCYQTAISLYDEILG